MATHIITGATTGDNLLGIIPFGQPARNDIYTVDGLDGNDTLVLNNNGKLSYNVGFVSTGFTIGAAVGGVVTVSGATSGGTLLSFQLTNVENIAFYDKTVAVTYGPDTTAPTIASFTSSTLNGTYKVGSTINLTATASEVLATGAQITVTLGTGATARTALLTGTGTTTLTGSYTVQAGDISTDLDITAFTLGTGTAQPKDIATIPNVMTSTTLPTGVSSLAGSKALVIDGVAPTLGITSNTSTLKAGQTATITFTFSEDPGASFVVGDIVATGGTLSGLTTTGTVRTATFTPTAGLASGNASITVAGANYTDLAGNTGGNGTTPAIAIDTLAPTVAIASNVAALKAGGTANITFTFSEDPGASFVVGDIVATNGTITGLTTTGTVRTATFTPTAGLASGTASITVAANTYTDTVGNTGGAGTTPPSIVIDTIAPTLTITSNTSTLKAGQTANITFTFSEDPGSSFVIGDIVATNGTITGLTTTGTVRTATFTPTAGLATGTASITVAAGNYADTAGNTGGAGITPSITIDTIAPTVAVTSNKNTLLANETAIITFTFSEDPGTSFTSADVSVAPGILGTLDTFAGSGTVRTAVFHPAANVTSTPASITVANASYADLAGNTGSTGTVGLTVATKSPTVTITSSVPAVKIGGTALITFTFSDAPGLSFTESDITTTGGALTAFTSTGPTTWTALFTPTAGITTNASITVLSGSYQDASGNLGAAGVTPALAIDTLAPTLAITSNNGTLNASQTATITFTFSEDPGASFVVGDIVATGGTLSGLTTTGTVRTATFTPTAGLASGNASITVAGANYTDLAGNTGGNGTTPAIAIDTLAPTVAIASNVAALKAGETANITFTFSEDPGTSFVVGDIAVTGGTLSGLTTSGTVRTAIFTPTAGLASGNASITVAGANYTDAFANTGGVGTTPTIAIDTLAPTVTTFSPADAATRVALTSNIVLTYSENIVKGTGSIDITTSTGTLVEHFTEASANITGWGTNTLTINPTADLVDNNHYVVAVTSGLVKDAAGNSYAGTTTYHFATPDTIAPTVATYNPTIGATPVVVDSNIVLTFNEDIARGTGLIEIHKDSAAGTLVESFNAATSSNLAISGNTLTINPTLDLGATSHYFVTFADGSVKDLVGLNYAGNSSTGATPYDFTTGVDNVAPVVTGFSPIDGATAVAVGSNLVFTFSENIVRGTGVIEVHQDSVGGAVVASTAGSGVTAMTATITGNTLTLNPSADLATQTHYFVTLAASAVDDLATTPNPFAASSTYDFTTADPYVAASSSSGGSTVAIVGGVAAVGVLAYFLWL